MFCPRCGAETDQSARYCAECGAGLPREGEEGKGSGSIRERLVALAGRSRRERRITLATVAAIVIAIAAFVALDTGDDDGDTGSDRVAVADVGAADAACVEAKTTIRRSARRALNSGEGGLQQYSADLLRAVVEFRSQVRALGGGEGIQELDRALRELAIEAGALSRSAREQGAVGDSLAAADGATAAVEAAITELGLDECSAVDLDPRSILAAP